MTFDISLYLLDKTYIAKNHPLALKYAHARFDIYTPDGHPPPDSYATTFLSWTLHWRIKHGNEPFRQDILTAVRKARYALMDDNEYAQMRQREYEFYFNMYLTIKAGKLRLTDESVLGAFREDIRKRSNENFDFMFGIVNKYTREDPEVAIQRVTDLVR